ncbi:hypothetical protein ACJX0J_022731, partial [Zea mays]
FVAYALRYVNMLLHALYNFFSGGTDSAGSTIFLYRIHLVLICRILLSTQPKPKEIQRIYIENIEKSFTLRLDAGIKTQILDLEL